MGLFVLRVQRVGNHSREFQQPDRGQPNLSAVHTRRRKGRAAVGPLQRHPEEHAIRTFEVKVAASLGELGRVNGEPASLERMNRHRHRDLVRGRRSFGCTL
jgi:hypothetical protein